MGSKSWSPRGTRFRGRRFSSKVFQVGDLRVSTRHLGEGRDDSPPYDRRHWWEVTVQLGSVVYTTEVGGSVAEWKDKQDASVAMADHVIQDLAKAYQDPDDYREWEIEESDPPRIRKLIEDFIVIAERFGEPLNEASELISRDWKNNIVLVSEEPV